MKSWTNPETDIAATKWNKHRQNGWKSAEKSGKINWISMKKPEKPQKSNQPWPIPSEPMNELINQSKITKNTQIGLGNY